MSTSVVIAVDAMGGDHAPAIVVDGVAHASRAQSNVRYVLHGREAEIAPLLEASAEAKAISEIRHTDAVVTMDDKPAEALRRARGSSMWNAVASVKEGEAGAAVSAGNTGALMAVSKVVLRMMANVHRPAIAASWPTPKGYSTVLDVGANVTSSPRQLVEFAIMGEAFSRAVHGGAKPTVGLLNVGAEDVKGNDTVRAAHELLRSAGLDLAYRGFVEGDDISMGAVDVVVTDGFTGNVALKTAEGTAKLVAGFLRDALGSGPLARVAAGFFALGGLGRLKARMDPRNVNGGVFLGLGGTVVKSHGGTDGLGFANALNIAANMARSPFREAMAVNLERLAAVKGGDDTPSSNGADPKPTREPEPVSTASSASAP